LQATTKTKLALWRLHSVGVHITRASRDVDDSKREFAELETEYKVACRCAAVLVIHTVLSSALCC
jgi:hypothetical protein